MYSSICTQKLQKGSSAWGGAKGRRKTHHALHGAVHRFNNLGAVAANTVAPKCNELGVTCPNAMRHMGGLIFSFPLSVAVNRVKKKPAEKFKMKLAVNRVKEKPAEKFKMKPTRGR